MIIKVLLLNRRILRGATPMAFCLGAMLMFFFGASILIGSFPSVDLNAYPKWSGYICMWAGLLLLLCFTVDAVYKILSPIFNELNIIHRKETLSQRIKRVEKAEFPSLVGKVKSE